MTRAFAYNTGATISGTTQVGSLAIGSDNTIDYSSDYGGVKWWEGPDENTGYVIAMPSSGNTQPTEISTNQLTLNGTYRGSDVNLSNNNQTAHQQFGYQQSVLGNTEIVAGDKVMFSILCTLSAPATLPNSHVIGFGTTSMNYQGNPYGGFPGNDTVSFGYSSDGNLYWNNQLSFPNLQTWGDGDIIDICLSGDQYSSGLWVRVNGGNWNNDPAAVAGTNLGIATPTNVPLFPVLCTGYEGTMTIQNFPKFDIPNGFTFLGNVTASLKFKKSKALTDNSFIDLTNNIFNQSFTGATDASVWLKNNGYWNSYPAPVLYLDAGDINSYPGTGTVWTDIVGGKVFNLMNSPGYDPGSGGSIYFDAAGNQYANCSTSLPSLPTFTISVWHYWDGSNTGGEPCILTEVYPGNTGQINYILGAPNGTPTKSGYFNGGWQLSPLFTLTPSTWYNIVTTCDSNQVVKVYLNNTLISSTSTTGAQPSSSQGGINLMRRWDNPEFWGGYLSTVGIYDTDLSSVQISGIYNATKSRYGL